MNGTTNPEIQAAVSAEEQQAADNLFVVERFAAVAAYKRRR
jgi:hypothetical protein